MIQLKSKAEIEILRENAELINEILGELIRMAQPGISTAELDGRAETLMNEAGVTSAFKGYRGFPATICASINEEVVHGIPSPDRVLDEGDLLSIDTGFERGGLYADKGDTVVVGAPTEETAELIGVAREALWRGIDRARHGNRVGDISNAIGSYVAERGYRAVRRFVGHGIGREMHEDPQIPNEGEPGRGPKLKAGMVVAIEPMVWKRDPSDDGTAEEWVADDEWTVLTPNGQRSAHVEEMVLITKGEPEVLTATDKSEGWS